jgi:hypothetical protein
MAKQIKIGLDKVPAPVTKQYTQLVDIEGAKLTDSAGNPVVTEDESVLGAFARAESSLSVFANNKGKRQSIPVVEQFPETSEVSSSLLGIPRAEEQLGLFSDVSTYGLDERNWNFYTFSNATTPGQWYNKENPVFGRRSNPTFNEGSEEQALYLKSFPSQYAFPGSTITERRTEPTESFKEYMNFIAMGKYLYNYFRDINRTFAENNFINDAVFIEDSLGRPTKNPPNYVVDPQGTGSYFDDQGLYFDVSYSGASGDIQSSFDMIERWTSFFNLIRDGEDTYPELVGSPISDFRATREHETLMSYCQGQCTPGGGSNAENFAILESKNTFRYQPGRVSGFTFGVRMQADPATNINFIEWGCSNDTDEYMFQLRGSQFNIVRRSVIRMPDELLIRQGLSPTDQSAAPIFPKGVGNTTPLWETIIPRTKFNGDNLLGSGRSGYILSFENVTMYKIEYSWYGAIGARFYAYTPSGNGDARWILMHTFIIENGLGKPVLKNPDFKFKYMVYSQNNATIKSPIYIYKYGSSYYIDGADEGTINLTTVTSESVPFNIASPVVGIMPKQKILNQEGVGITNYKKAYPLLLSVNSSEACRIDARECTGSPDGIHYTYSVSLSNGIHPDSRVLNLQYQPGGGQINIVDDGVEFEPIEDGAKIIADGVYNVHVKYDQADPAVTDVVRRDGTHALVESPVVKSLRANGSILDPSTGTVDFTGRISAYRTIAASTVGISTDNFKIHFLNPITRDGQFNRQVAEFAIGVTPFRPEIEEGTGILKFRNDVDDLVDFDKRTNPTVEWTSVGTDFDYLTRAETREWDPGYGQGGRLSVDPRLPQPPGVDSGYISAIRGQVRLNDYKVTDVQPGDGDRAGQWKIVFESQGPSDSILDIREDGSGTSEVGVNGIGLGIYYTSFTVKPGGITPNFVWVSGDPRDQQGNIPAYIQTKTVSLLDDWQAVSYDDNGNSRFGYREFIIGKAVKFNSQPLYLVFLLKDYANVNNIIVEEISANSIRTHTPKFIKDSANLQIKNSGGSSDQFTPASFNGVNRLDGVRFDTSTLNPLRPSTILHTFYVQGGTPEQIDLSSVFGRDRNGLARGLLNNKAVFFTATKLRNIGNIEMTLTVKEQ